MRIQNFSWVVPVFFSLICAFSFAQQEIVSAGIIGYQVENIQNTRDRYIVVSFVDVGGVENSLKNFIITGNSSGMQLMVVRGNVTSLYEYFEERSPRGWYQAGVVRFAGNDTVRLGEVLRLHNPQNNEYQLTLEGEMPREIPEFDEIPFARETFEKNGWLYSTPSGVLQSETFVFGSKKETISATFQISDDGKTIQPVDSRTGNPLTPEDSKTLALFLQIGTGAKAVLDTGKAVADKTGERITKEVEGETLVDYLSYLCYIIFSVVVLAFATCIVGVFMWGWRKTATFIRRGVSALTSVNKRSSSKSIRKKENRQAQKQKRKKRR